VTKAFRIDPTARSLPDMSDSAPTPHDDVGVAQALVELADTLVDDFDTIDFLHVLAARATQLLPVDAGGVMVNDQQGHLRVVAASSEEARLLELFELQNDEGPCLDAFRSRAAIPETDLEVPGHPWPLFAGEARAAGFRVVLALPLRLRDEALGALNLFGVTPGRVTDADMRLGQALADVATIGLLQQRTVRRRDLLAEQLQTALHSRVVLEQAKGVLAERNRVTLDQAFAGLRDYARAHQLLLGDAARAVVDDTVHIPIDAGAPAEG
jgi:GAF domain-containing protein